MPEANEEEDASASISPRVSRASAPSVQISSSFKLPDELIFYIFSFLSLPDLYSAAQVDRHFKSIVDDCKLILNGESKFRNYKNLSALYRFVTQRVFDGYYVNHSSPGRIAIIILIIMNR